MSNSEILKLGAFPIQVGEMVNPVTFWGCKIEDKAHNADLKLLAELEAEMTTIFQKGNAAYLSKPYIGCVSNIFYSINLLENAANVFILSNFLNNPNYNSLWQSRTLILTLGCDLKLLRSRQLKAKF